MATTDQLFILRPHFFDGERGPFYCGDSVSVEGLLSFFPTLREWIDVQYIDFPHPRAEIVARIGDANQSLPVLVLASESRVKDPQIPLSVHNGVRFINREADIRRYLSTQYGLPSAS